MKRHYSILIILFLVCTTTASQSYIDFTTDDINGNEVVLSSWLKQGPVMLAFWRTWCPSCKDEQKAIQQLYEKHEPKGFQYIGINIDNQKSVAKVKPYVAAHNFTFTVIMDTDRKIFEMCGANDDIMPYSIIIDSEGKTIASHIGFKTGDESIFEEDIKRILNIE